LFLNTLPKREILSGFAEIIKHALIADHHYWNAIRELNFTSFTQWKKIIEHSINLKLNIVASDLKDKGLRQVLNFGHTIGHALESWFWQTNTPYLHGEAIAQGMIAEAYLSVKSCSLPETDFQEITSFLQTIYGKCRPFDVVEVLEIMQQDKKMKNGTLQFALLKHTGYAEHNIAIPLEDVIEALHYLNNY
jgi:3-dehydroquinate synthase